MPMWYSATGVKQQQRGEKMVSLMSPAPLLGEAVSENLANALHRVNGSDTQAPAERGAVERDCMDAGLVSLLFDD